MEELGQCLIVARLCIVNWSQVFLGGHGNKTIIAFLENQN